MPLNVVPTLLTGLVSGLSLAMTPSLAQDTAAGYPKKQIRMILPQSPGAAMDVIARLMSQKLLESWGQVIVVDNRPGASGNMGSALAARAVPDGYTLLFSAVGMMTINPILYKNVGFEPRKDFAPVALLAFAPIVLVRNPSFPVNSLKDLIQLAKLKPGQLVHGSSGNGTPGHLIMEALKLSAKIDMIHIPFKGAAPALTALYSGDVQLISTGLGSAMEHLKAGKLKPLAVANRTRTPLAPDIPTMSESGLAGVDDLLNWYAIFAPAGTPRAIVTKLNDEILRILQTPAVKDYFAHQGFEGANLTTEQFGAYLDQQAQTWTTVVRASKAKVD